MKKTVFIILFTITAYYSTTIIAQNADYVNLLDYKKGARVVDFSSNYGSSWDVSNVLENAETGYYGDLPAWCTVEDAPFPHYVTIEMPLENWLDMIVFNNKIPEDNEGSYPGVSAKDIEVYVSNTSALSGFTKVAAFKLEDNKNRQLVSIMPVKAKWVKFVITSNYGNASYTELGVLGVFDNKKRPVNISDEINKQGFIDLYGLYFDFGSDVLKPESEQSILQIVQYMNQNMDVKILIEGHTDNVGSEASNQKLSENRANRVKTELVKKGISNGRLSVSGMGSKKPIADNSTDFGRAQNRRVTIRKS